MVDKDKIKDKLGSEDGDNDSNTKRDSGRRGGGRSGSSDGNGVNDDDRGGGGSSNRKVDRPSDGDDEVKSQAEQLQEFKKGTGVDVSDEDVGGVPRDQMEDMLKGIASMALYVEGKMRATENHNNDREEVRHNIAGVIYDQFTELISQHDVQLIAEKYGYDWEDDIIEEVLTEEDTESRVGIE